MKKVDFEYVDFDSYAILRNQIEQMNILQSDTETFEFEVEEKLDKMKEKVKLYESNLSLFFNLMSRKGGFGFAKKAQWELKNRNETETEQDFVLEDFDLIEFECSEKWRHDIGKMCQVKRGVFSDEHPFREGDLVEIVAFTGHGKLDGKWQYIVRHESSNEETTFIMNDNELI